MRFRLLRSGAFCMSGWSTSICIIVGTSSTSVTRSRMMLASTASGAKPGTNAWVLPRKECIIDIAMSARWNIGAACR